MQQHKIKASLKRLPNGSRSKETVNNKTKTQGESFLFIFFVKKWNLGRILSIFIHSLINTKSNATVWAACGLFSLPLIPW